MSETLMSSEESRKLYAERKKQVLELLGNARDYYEQEDTKQAEVFSNLYKDLENGEFSIVIVGEFSAGKSTLLNALMGNRILPSFSNETTATVNFLRHSDKSEHGEAGKVFYNNGSQEILDDASLDTIMKFVSTKGDEVAKKVDHLDLYLDSDFLKDGVTLVDSPGLNGVADGHREITEAQILKSHASIFLFNSDHPGSKTDFEFLHDLQSKVKTIIFVLNKIDEIKADENETPETVIETLKKTYKEKFPEETSVPEIWPVAAYPALVARNEEPLEYHDRVNRTEDERKSLEETSRLKDFENRLLSFLTCGEKAKQQLLAPVERVIALAIETKQRYEEEKGILETSVDTTEIENKIIAAKESVESLEKQKEDSRIDVSSKISEVLRDIMEELSAQISRLQDRKLAEIDEFDDWEEIVSYLQSFERNFIQKVYSIALTQEENLRDKMIAVIRMQYASSSGMIESKFLNSNIELQLSVSEHLETGERMFEAGIREMDEKIKNLEDQVKKLGEEAEEAEKDFHSAKSKEKKKSELKIEIQNLEEYKKTIELLEAPPIERYSTEVNEKVARGGLVGTVVDIVVGKKTVTRYETKTDRKEHDAFVDQRNKQIDEINKQIKDKEGKIDRIDEGDAELAESVHLRKIAESNAIREKLEDAMKENEKKIGDKNKKEIRKIKRELTDYCDTITDELENKVKKVLRESEQAYIEVVLDTVVGGIKEKLKDKEKYLEQLKKQMEASEEDRDCRIEELKKKIDEISVLIGNASDLQVSLSNMQVDTIKQETL